MEDFEKIQHREFQRQQLLEELKRVVWNQLNEEGIIDERANENSFWWGLITSATAYIHGPCPQKITDVFFISSVDLFRHEIVGSVHKFTPVEAERNFIMAEMMKYAVEEMNRPIYRRNLLLSVPPTRHEFLKQIGLDKLEE